MGVGVRVVEWLRSQGHDAVHLREEGLHRAPDEQVLAKAVAEERIILTFDLDFGDLAALMPDRPARIILLRLVNEHTLHVIERLSTAPGLRGRSGPAGGPGHRRSALSRPLPTNRRAVVQCGAL